MRMSEELECPDCCSDFTITKDGINVCMDCGFGWIRKENGEIEEK